MIRPRARALFQPSVVYALLLLALLAALTPRLADFWTWSVSAIVWPTGIDYGEGIVWEQVVGMVDGAGYGPVKGIPAIVYHYPPLYHLAVAAAARFARDPLQSGRIVSLVATLATAVLLTVATRRLIGAHEHRVVAWFCAAIAGTMFLDFDYVRYWAPLMRVDPLAVLFTVGGLLCGMSALRAPRLVYAAAVLFVLAAYTKQTSVVAPVAVFGPLLVVRRALALRGIAVAMVLGLALLGVMLAVTDGRFLKHLIGYNINRFSLAYLRANLVNAKNQLDLVALAFAGGSALFFLANLFDRRCWTPEQLEQSVALTMVLVLLVLKTASLVMLGKFGASTNYWIELLLPASMLIGLGLVACFRAALEHDPGEQGHGKRALMFAMPLALAGGQLFHPVKLPDLAADEAVEQRLIATVRHCRGWVVGDDMVAIMRGGKRIVWEPAIFADLAATHVYDQQPAIDAFTSGRVCAVIMERDPNTVKSRYNPPVLAAIERSYAHRYVWGKWLVFTNT